MTDAAVQNLIRRVNAGKINSWDEVHAYYFAKSDAYTADKFRHAFVSLLEILKIGPAKFTKKLFVQLLQQALTTKEWMVNSIESSRAKDYSNPFRKMVYENEKEMGNVLGRLDDNSFILQQKDEMKQFRIKVQEIIERL